MLTMSDDIERDYGHRYKGPDTESKKYEKPLITKQTKMNFPLDILESTEKGAVCKQCSSCHSCR